MQVMTTLNIPTALYEAHSAGSLWATSLARNDSGQLPQEHDFILSFLCMTMQAASLLRYFWNVAQCVYLWRCAYSDI